MTGASLHQPEPEQPREIGPVENRVVTALCKFDNHGPCPGRCKVNGHEWVCECECHTQTIGPDEIGPVDICRAKHPPVDHVELVDLDTGSTIAWPADQPIERQVRRP